MNDKKIERAEKAEQTLRFEYSDLTKATVAELETAPAGIDANAESAPEPATVEMPAAEMPEAPQSERKAKAKPSKSAKPGRAKKRKHKKKRYLLKFFILAVLVAAAVFVMHLDYFNIEEIYIEGNENITDAKVLELAEIKTGQCLFDVHPLIAQHRIKKNFYVDKVNVTRKPPGYLEIIITERTGMAQFRKGDKFVITDSEGKVLAVKQTECKITEVTGLKVSKAEVGDKIGTTNKEALEKALELIKITEENDMYFKRVSVSGNNVNAYIYDTLNCKGKYKNVISALKSGVLKSVVYDLYQKGEEKGTISVSSNDYCFFTPRK